MSRTSLLLAFVAGTQLLSGCATQKPRQDEHILTEEAARTDEPVLHEQPAPVVARTKEAKRAIGTIRRSELVQVLDAAPGRFLQHVETEPRLVGGRFHGWKLAAFFPGDERFAGVDLEPGDVILSVNGNSLEQPDQLMKVWDGLRTGTSLVVALERDGQPRQLRFEIRE